MVVMSLKKTVFKLAVTKMVIVKLMPKNKWVSVFLSLRQNAQNGDKREKTKAKTSVDFKKLIEEIEENSSIQIIVKAKNEEAMLELLNDLLIELEELNNLRKIESLEKELINNLDENSYSELIKLKSQVNRE